MAKVRFTAALKRFYPNLQTEEEASGSNVFEVLESIDKKYPGIKTYILEEDGSLRKHVNIFLKEELINDRVELSDLVEEEDEILIYQALSGG